MVIQCREGKFYHDELITILTEVEAVINCRPLTYLSTEDLEEPITPSHFLCGRRILSLPDNLNEDTEEEFVANVTRSDLDKRLQHLNGVLNKFWRRWKGEYLLELREAHRRHGGKPSAEPPTIGDIVLVEDEQEPRCLWKLAKVRHLIVGRDGHPRGAVLHVPSSGGNGTLQRPLQRLYPLEITACSTPVSPDQHSQESPVSSTDNEVRLEDEVPPSSRRSQRVAARTARDRMAACAVLEEDSID